MASPTFDMAPKTSSERPSQKEDNQRLDIANVIPEEERKLRWIYDLNLLPPLAFMFEQLVFFWVLQLIIAYFRYLCNALDKGNVGNAKTDHWDKVKYRREVIF